MAYRNSLFNRLCIVHCGKILTIIIIIKIIHASSVATWDPRYLKQSNSLNGLPFCLISSRPTFLVLGTNYYNFTLYLHSRSTIYFRMHCQSHSTIITSHRCQPLVLYNPQITAGISQTCLRPHVAVPALFQAP